MAKCNRCGKKFKMSEARDSYNDHFDGELDYDEDYGKDDPVCDLCAISESESQMSVGRANLMTSGDDDYDDGFVDRWL